jgi:hypothetical protein
MRLFIRIKYGQPFEHPIMEDNFREAFPDVDVDNLPDWVMPFVRVPPPELGVYEKYLGVTYEPKDGVITDVHHTAPMSAEEILEKQAKVKAVWAQEGFPSWVFDEPACRFVPPIPYPDDGGVYYWDEPTTAWVKYNFEATRV